METKVTPPTLSTTSTMWNTRELRADLSSMTRVPGRPIGIPLIGANSPMQSPILAAEALSALGFKRERFHPLADANVRDAVASGANSIGSSVYMSRLVQKSDS
jgi:hypothetical protein